MWCDRDGLRIWRSPKSSFYGDECLDAAEVYTDADLAAIADEGFNAVWLRGRLYELVHRSGPAELRRPRVAERLASLRTVIERGRRRGVKVCLFFNEPLALPADDPFWVAYPKLAGQPHRDPIEHRDMVALCTSHATVLSFFADMTRELLAHLPGLGGVILITASEDHSHCWSHHARTSLDDGFVDRAREPLRCPRCRDREPAEVVADLVRCWVDAAAAVAPSPGVICWNWSWSMWYPDPQREVIERLPQGVSLLVDFERGLAVRRLGRTLTIDEYALSAVGPSERFLGAKRSADQRGLSVLAKVQLNTTHELATVPNLPLITNLHAKLVRMTDYRVAGVMGCWNFGASATLNTAAMRLYLADPDRYRDADRFFDALARQYFALRHTGDLVAAWRHWARAFESYPFATRLLYRSPINYAPAYPFTPEPRGTPMGPSWRVHDWGDRLDDCLPKGFTADDLADAFDTAATAWHEGLGLMQRTLDHEPLEQDTRDHEPAKTHRAREFAVAEMIGLHLQSTAHLFRFHAWRTQRTGDSGAPLPPPIAELLRAERRVAEHAAELLPRHPGLAYHQEPQARLFTIEQLNDKTHAIAALLGRGSA